MGLAAARGRLSAGLFIFIPFLYGRGPLAALGVAALMLGLLLTVFNRLPGLLLEGPGSLDGPGKSESPQRRGGAGGAGIGKRVRHGGVLFIGPLPILWGSDSSMAKLALALGLGLLTLLLILSLFIG